MNYAEKVKATRGAQDSVTHALSLIDGITYMYHPRKRYGVVSIYNTATGEFDKEAILNIFWNGDSTEPNYTLISYPHSDVPFNTRKGALDTNRDGTIQIQEIIDIAAGLFQRLND